MALPIGSLPLVAAVEGAPAGTRKAITTAIVAAYMRLPLTGVVVGVAITTWGTPTPTELDGSSLCQPLAPTGQRRFGTAMARGASASVAGRCVALSNVGTVSDAVPGRLPPSTGAFEERVPPLAHDATRKGHAPTPRSG